MKINLNVPKMPLAKLRAPAEPALMRLPKGTLPFDGLMIASMLALMLTGFVMISSASMDVAADNFGGPFFFIFRHGLFVLMSLLAFSMLVRIPMYV